MPMPIKLFFSYAHEDEPLLVKLKMHLKPLQREGLIDVWYDRNISGGAEWSKEIDKHLNTAHVILLLVSPDFINSDYCYGVELARAFERHANGEACLIPVLLRPVAWQGLLGKLQALPKNGKPVKSRHWRNMDEALSEIALGIRETIDTLPKESPVDKEEISLKQQSHIEQLVEAKETMTLSFEEKKRISAEPTHPDSTVWQASKVGILSVKTGKKSGRAYEIENTLSIGRSSECTIFLEDLGVSRNHAFVDIDNNGHYILVDLGSSNGTIVNGKTLEKDATYYLVEGDEIQVGQTTFVFEKR